MNTSSMFHRPAKLLVAGSLLFGALLAGQTAFAQTSMINSKHDLSSGSTTNLAFKSTSTTEVCVFCHTPHGANALAPLWNRNASASVFTYYTSASMNAATASSTSIALQSTMCLSCHDGATALNSLINSPGSGTGTPPTMGGATMPVGAANLGIALNNDHPIGITYCGGAGGSVTAPNGCVDKDFKLTNLVKNNLSQSAVAFAAGVATDTWYLDVPGVGTALTRDKTDLPLYVGTGFLVPTVQCATCHEPHNANGTATMVSFLRTPNNASIICTTCHAK